MCEGGRGGPCATCANRKLLAARQLSGASGASGPTLGGRADAVVRLKLLPPDETRTGGNRKKQLTKRHATIAIAPPQRCSVTDIAAVAAATSDTWQLATVPSG